MTAIGGVTCNAEGHHVRPRPTPLNERVSNVTLAETQRTENLQKMHIHMRARDMF